MIGPAIPEALLKKKQQKNNDEIEISLSDEEEEEQQHTVGPQIPAHLLQQKRQQNKDEIIVSDHEDEPIGPQIPQAAGPQIPQHILEKKQQQAAGPQIPEHLIAQKQKKNEDEIAISDDEQDDTVAGPQIPQEESPDDFAPALPPDLLEQRRQQAQQQPQQEQKPPQGRRRRPVGPTMPTGPIPSQDEDDFVVGPALPKDYNPEEEAKYSAIQAIEERARLAKEAMEEKKADKGKVERPEWMLVPPEVDYLRNANSGKSRQFNNKTMTAEERDSSGWTETPAERQRRLEDEQRGRGKRKAETESVDYSAKDVHIMQNVQQYNMESRPMSLLEIHQQKKKKERKTHGLTAEEDVTKRAFDREKDLLGGARKISRKDKQELVRKSTELGQKFGYGKSSFL